MRAVVGHQLGRHGLERAGEEHVEQQRFDEVVGMMAERDLGRADLGRHPVQHAAAQPRAQRARRLVGVENVLDHLADAGVLDAVLPAARLAGLRDEIVLVFLVAGIDVDGDEREANGRALAEDVEDLQQRPAVLSARQPDHDAVAVLDHLVVDDRLGRLLGEPRLEIRAIPHATIVSAVRRPTL